MVIKMNLSELLKFEEITLQCHDNPDPDAIGAAYALYKYFTAHGKTTRIVYSGRYKISKCNLKQFVSTLNIPIEHITLQDAPYHGLLITVDCQYGEGNVSTLRAEEIAIIDHHRYDIDKISSYKYVEINPEIGSCSTIVWKMLIDEGFSIEDDEAASTALYYGLMTDTSNFYDMYHAYDEQMRNSLNVNKGLIRQYSNSNMSLEELILAGSALLQHKYIFEHRLAIMHANQCDPAILGVISDMALQVDVIDVCIIYSQNEEGYKFSIRSCERDIHANELAKYLSTGIGSGGGHYEKAGGIININDFIDQEFDGQIPVRVEARFEKYILNKINHFFEINKKKHAFRIV